MKNKVIQLGVMGVFLLMFSYGNAQEKGKGKKPPTFTELLEKMDKNDDGMLSKDEVKGPLKDNFAEIDTDEDGYITEEEMKKAPKPERPERN
ncbi:EF-hand domain-containing protein [Cellulophaga sp. Z1A5H]|uniref:EF-hand domain-containing protein n=1 Tax=Cellulophaga sp. Z1A5H TaxID=2687291 RepID=UPI00196ACCDB|nr:EF-hand domain-containing protein [Cellulophaga sp. Z1A5H]